MQTAQEPFQRTVNGKPFPLVFKPASQTSREDFLKTIQQDKDKIRTLIKEHGAVLLRGFDPIATPKDFDEIINLLEFAPLPYVGGAAVRNKVHGGVFTSNESPPECAIPYHHEMA